MLQMCLSVGGWGWGWGISSLWYLQPLWQQVICVCHIFHVYRNMFLLSLLVIGMAWRNPV